MNSVSYRNYILWIMYGDAFSPVGVGANVYILGDPMNCRFSPHLQLENNLIDDPIKLVSFPSTPPNS